MSVIICTRARLDVIYNLTFAAGIARAAGPMRDQFLDDEAVARAFLAALQPAALAATLAAAERLESDRDAVLKQWRLGVERASYEVQRAERRYRAVDPDNRLVARGLEREWEERLRALAAAKADLERRERQQPRVISQQ